MDLCSVRLLRRLTKTSTKPSSFDPVVWRAQSVGEALPGNLTW